ncbi:TrmB family transcriptional regulator [Haladaptatus caseinilyticus]|uniref:TrmB family transcriptional regulator n=1 Tax=Haladaptatus caseinilyticus TaxID=2993314 RepID=UPI00224A96B9|nr:TrmB family transcriptional regulator sugar-binding domain-containing protein [Haladaptatus caseinilyticus]
MTKPHPVDEKTLREELHTFGFSEKEIETYLVVLNQGEATPSTIATHADVSKRYVYNIASQLAKRGFVQVNNHASPTTVRAQPPTEAITDLSNRLQSLAPSLEQKFQKTEPQTARFQTIKSRQTALKHLREQIRSAQNEVFLSLPLSEQNEIEAELTSAVDRNVFVACLYTDAEPESIAPARFNGNASVVRVWEEKAPFISTVDDHTAIVGDAELLGGVHADETAVSLSEEHLAGSVLGSLIGSYWPIASELYVMKPSELPYRFESARNAVLQATLHLHEGTEPLTTIMTENGEEITGRILDSNQCLVKPETGDFPVENGLVVETSNGDKITVGGTGAFIEDYRAETIKLDQPSA